MPTFSDSISRVGWLPGSPLKLQPGQELLLDEAGSYEEAQALILEFQDTLDECLPGLIPGFRFRTERNRANGTYYRIFLCRQNE